VEIQHVPGIKKLISLSLLDFPGYGYAVKDVVLRVH
jgi:GTP-binding protein EngB required for normal cell division